MLAPGTLLHAGNHRPGSNRNTGLVVMRARSACDDVRRPGVRSGLQRSLMTGGQRVGDPGTDRVGGDVLATRLPGRGSRSPTCGDAASHADSTAARLCPVD